MQEFDYYRAHSMAELLALLEQTGGRVLGGGTDLLPRMRRAEGHAGSLVDSSGIAELRGIRLVGEQVRIGAGTTHADLAASPLIRTLAPGLAQAAAAVGSPQTRERGTLAGNLANASPAADSAPALLALQAEVGLRSRQGRRRVPLEQFLLGPGATCLAPAECIEEVCFRRPSGCWGVSFHKVGRRNAMAISVVNGAAFLELDGQGRVATARLALGSVGPRAVRCGHPEALLIGQVAERELFRRAGAAVQADIAPIADVRASAEYRRRAAAVVLERVLEAAWEQAMGRLS